MFYGLVWYGFCILSEFMGFKVLFIGCFTFYLLETGLLEFCIITCRYLGNVWGQKKFRELGKYSA